MLGNIDRGSRMGGPAWDGYWKKNYWHGSVEAICGTVEKLGLSLYLLTSLTGLVMFAFERQIGFFIFLFFFRYIHKMILYQHAHTLLDVCEWK